MNDADREIVERLQAQARYARSRHWASAELLQESFDLIESQSQRIEELEALEEVVNAFKQGADGIHKLVTEIIDGRAELTHLREVISRNIYRLDPDAPNDEPYMLTAVATLILMRLNKATEAPAAKT